MVELKRSQQMSEILKLVAPGKPLREGLENVLRAKTGALIVLGYNHNIMNIIDGGFSINADFTPAHLYELAKMDGAIILSADGKKILFANTQLIPDTSIPSSETGIRHRTAERVAKQTGQLVVSISQRRNVITLYQGDLRYTLRDISVILTKANQALQTLEKYKAVLDQALTNLGALEFEEMVTLQEVVMVIQRIGMVLRIKAEINTYINELGSEGRLISMQLEELVSNLEEETLLLLKDYCREKTDPEQVLTEIKQLAQEELLLPNAIVRLLGYTGSVNVQEETVSPRGYRLLSKIPRLPVTIVNNIVEKFHDLPKTISASIEDLDEVDGVGEIRARAIKEGLTRLQEQMYIDRHI